jgi:hypothetical protein
LTYGGQGTAKAGVKAQNHAIIFIDSAGKAPEQLKGEERLILRPIRVDPLSRHDKLNPESRINYAKVYTVEHNIKVAFIGRIHADSRSTFLTDFKRIDQS